MTLIFIGIAVAFNCIILVHKFRKERYADTALDFSILVCICFLFNGSFSALAVGTIASMIVSFYLLWKPVAFNTGKKKRRRQYAR